MEQYLLSVAGVLRLSHVPPKLPGLNAYRAYCSNQLAAKALLDQKKQDPRVQDFLQRCLESPFSRKLDLWSFLDIPRSRLVKYPLLLKEILRHTPPDDPDTASLEEAVSTDTSRLSKREHFGDWLGINNVFILNFQISIIQAVLADINMKKGESECQYYIDKLEYLDDRQKDPRIEQCKSLLCHGELRNKSGTVSWSWKSRLSFVQGIQKQNTKFPNEVERHCF